MHERYGLRGYPSFLPERETNCSTFSIFLNLCPCDRVCEGYLRSSKVDHALGSNNMKETPIQSPFKVSFTTAFDAIFLVNRMHDLTKDAECSQGPSALYASNQLIATRLQETQQKLTSLEHSDLLSLAPQRHVPRVPEVACVTDDGYEVISTDSRENGMQADGLSKEQQ